MSDASIHGISLGNNDSFASANEPFWTDLRIAALIRLRAEGLKTGEIGARMGISKNAVCGKLGRLGLSVPRSGEPALPRVVPRAGTLIPWTDERVAALREGVAAGKSCELIGERLGISKSAVFNKAKRLGLTPLPRVVETARKAKPPPPAPAPKVTLPRLKCLATERPRPPQPLVCRGRVQPCSYIVSGYGRRSTFCDAPSLPGKSECLHHHTICRRPVPDNGRIGVARAA